MRDLVSIIIPVFHGARFVGEAIESALGQSWPATEVIVVDDGSEDGGATRRAVARFGDAVRVIAKPNGGVATALNAGIAAMRGAWFSWLSHDDLYHPLKIERYMAALRDRTGPAVAFGDVDLVDESARLLHRQELTRGFEGEDGRWAVLEGRINGCAMLVPRVCFDACGGFDPGLPTTQDYAYWYRLAHRFPFVPVREALVRSRVHAAQGSRVARHLAEVSLLWSGMVEELEGEMEEAPLRERLRPLRRAERFLRQTGYAGGRAFVEARLGALLREVPVALVLSAGAEAGLEAALAVLAAAGGQATELVILDRTAGAAPALDLAMRPRPLPAAVARLAAGADTSEILRATVAGATAPLLVFLDPAMLPTAEALREALLAVASGQAAAYLPQGPDQPHAAPFPAVLRGAVLDREAVAAVVGQDPVLAALARGAHIATTADMPPPAPAAARAAAPMPFLQRPAAGAMPVLARPPRPGWPTLLLLVHGWGGGTIRYAATLGARFAGRVNLLYAWGVSGRTFCLSSLGPDVPEAEFDLRHGIGAPVAVLARLGVARVDVMHSIGFDDHLEEFLDQLGVPHDMTLLDYHQVANGPHLTDAEGRFVGDAALARPDHPARRQGPPRLVLRSAERIIACSRDLAARAGRLAPGLRILAARLPEPEKPQGFAVHAPPLAADEVMRVLYLGRVASHKGMDLLSGVARRAAERCLGIQISCLGGVDRSLPVETQFSQTMRLLGAYEQEDLNTLVCRLRPHLAWLPFTAPETHSFALSDVMAQGLPVLATGIGAVPERLAERPSTWLLPPEEATVEGFLDWLDRLRRERLTTPPRWLPTAHLPSLVEHFYERDYLRPLLRSAPALPAGLS